MLMLLIYAAVMIFQLVVNAFIVFSGDQAGILFEFKKLVAVFMIFVPFFVLYMNFLYASQKRFLPAVQDASAVSFQMLKELCSHAGSFKNTIVKSRNSLNRSNLAEIAGIIRGTARRDT